MLVNIQPDEVLKQDDIIYIQGDQARIEHVYHLLS
jgi:K+/H+ antiporter YhaU regulatory subunit KhtT